MQLDKADGRSCEKIVDHDRNLDRDRSESLFLIDSTRTVPPEAGKMPAVPYAGRRPALPLFFFDDEEASLNIANQNIPARQEWIYTPYAGEIILVSFGMCVEETNFL